MLLGKKKVKKKKQKQIGIEYIREFQIFSFYYFNQRFICLTVDFHGPEITSHIIPFLHLRL